VVKYLTAYVLEKSLSIVLVVGGGVVAISLIASRRDP